MRIPTRLRAPFTAAAASAVITSATIASATIASAAIVGAAIAGAAPASASTIAAAHPAGHGYGASHAVFVQTDNTAGNRVVAYHRAAGGTLTPAGSYATGGRGGILAGSVVDHTASQGSLAYDPGHALLYAVNAGSNTISVFAVSGDKLALRQVIGSGGTFPVSVAVHGDTAYVLNALHGGSVQGYRVFGGSVATLPGSHRALGLNPNATPQFTTTPGPGRVHPGRRPAHRDHQGQRQRHRRVRRRRRRLAVGQADREHRAGRGPVRGHLRHLR